MRTLTMTVLVATCVLASCQGGIPTFSVTLNDPADITMRPGDVVLIGDEPLRLTFQRVVEDSRCPRDVQCVWAGNGMVRLGLTLGTDPEWTADVNTTLEPSHTAVGKYRISLVTLAPEPVSTSSIPSDAYRIHLLVELQPPPPPN